MKILYKIFCQGFNKGFHPSFCNTYFKTPHVLKIVLVSNKCDDTSPTFCEVQIISAV